MNRNDFRNLLPEDKRNAFDDFVDLLESDAAEAKGELVSAVEAHGYELRDLSEMLDAVRYWLLDILVHHKPPSDPRRMLRRVEQTLYGEF